MVSTKITLVISTIVSSLGGFLFGYDTLVISGAIGHLAQSFHLDAANIGHCGGPAWIEARAVSLRGMLCALFDWRIFRF